jgi:hypothetical protein
MSYPFLPSTNSLGSGGGTEGHLVTLVECRSLSLKPSQDGPGSWVFLVVLLPVPCLQPHTPAPLLQVLHLNPQGERGGLGWIPWSLFLKPLP